MRLSDVLAIDSLTARDATFAQGLFLSSVRVAGSVELSWASVGAEVSLSDVHVEEDLLLPRVFDGPTTLSDIGVGRNLVLADGLLQDVTIERLLVRGSSRLDGGHFSGKLVIGESDFGKTFKANQTVFSGDCEFRRVRFPGEDPMAGALFARAPTLIETNLPREPTVQSDKVDNHETDQPDDDENPEDDNP
jgi:hypothetical protein